MKPEKETLFWVRGRVGVRKLFFSWMNLHEIGIRRFDWRRKLEDSLVPFVECDDWLSNLRSHMFSISKVGFACFTWNIG